MEFFETSTEPGVFPSDKNLTQWIKVARMAEEFSTALAPGDPSDPSDPGISDYRAQIILEGFLERMAAWRQAATGTMTAALDLFSRSTTKHLYDLMLNTERTPDDFRPLVFEALVARAQRELTTSPPTKFRAEVLRACLVSVHSCLDLFLGFSPDSVRRLPGLFYLEIGYSIGLLLKISFVAALSSRVLDRTQIQFGEYSDRVLGFLEVVTERNKWHATERLRLTMMGLRNWVENHKHKIGELSALSAKGAVPQQYPAGEPFGGYSGRGQETPMQAPVSVSVPVPVPVPVPVRVQVQAPPVQEMGGGGGGGGDPMVWENFPLTEFLQLDGVPELYSWG